MSPQAEHDTGTGPRRLGWHPVDPVSLVAGLIAVGLALVSLVGADVDGHVVVPALLLGAGVVGLVAALRRERAG